MKLPNTFARSIGFLLGGHDDNVATEGGITMRTWIAAIAAVLSWSAPAMSATYVYVSNAEDGDIGLYTLAPDGSLKPGQRFAAGKPVMPMTVSPDKRWLVAAIRSKPFTAHTYGIDRANGALKPAGTGPLAESFPYITFDR